MYKGVDCIQESRNNSTKNKMSVVLGITISAGLIIALALMVVITVYWKKFRAKQPLSKGQKLEIQIGLNKDDSIFTLDEMIEATQNFSQRIQQGGFGTVFYGKLPDGKEIAITVVSRISSEGVRQFLNEVNLLSRVHHKNLVSLLGYCIESKESMLIYDYTSKGPLWKHLHGQSTGLNWKTRLKIAIGVAEGLQYLHVCCTPMIIHRNVKSRNILLDSNLNGKLCDFGLSMMTMDKKVPIETANFAGTLGYMDPEYHTTQQLTQKSDVYSFGVVLLEIICGREIIDANLPDEERNLISWVKEYVRINEDPAKIVEIIDKKMDGNYDMRSISIVAKLALRCVEDRSSLRPSISEVVGDLKEAIMYEKVYKAPVAKHRYSRGGVTIQDGR